MVKNFSRFCCCSSKLTPNGRVSPKFKQMFNHIETRLAGRRVKRRVAHISRRVNLCIGCYKQVNFFKSTYSGY